MRKRDELTDPNGCMFRARDEEMTFVLLGRDIAAPATIRSWIAERIRLGKNEPGDPQLVEAEECARVMEAERAAPIARGPLADVIEVAEDEQSYLSTEALLRAAGPWEEAPDPPGAG